MADSQIQSWVINSIVWELATLVHREDNLTSTSQQLISELANRIAWPSNPAWLVDLWTGEFQLAEGISIHYT